MTPELRTMITSGRLVPAFLATVKHDGDDTARVVREAVAATGLVGTVHREGPRGAAFCLASPPHRVWDEDRECWTKPSDTVAALRAALPARYTVRDGFLSVVVRDCGGAA